MNTTMSPFHWAGSTHTWYTAPELSRASVSVQWSPLDCKTSCGCAAGASGAAGCTARSEQAFKTTRKITIPRKASTRDMAAPSGQRLDEPLRGDARTIPPRFTVRCRGQGGGKSTTLWLIFSQLGDAEHVQPLQHPR